MSFRQVPLDRILDLQHNLLIKLMAGSHLQKQHHTLIVILWSTLTNADRVDDLIRKVSLQNTIDFSGPEADTAGVEHTVSTTKERHVFGHRMNDDKIAVRPDVIKACEIRRVELRALHTNRRLIVP